MLLLDDDDVLPDVPDAAEAHLAAQLGNNGLERIDQSLRRHAQDRWLKVARVVAYALRDGGFSRADEDTVRLHVRRVGLLVESGKLEAQGNPHQPRWCEVRTNRTPGIR